MELNREKLADFLGCSLRTIDDYVRNGMPGEAPQRPGGQWRFDSGGCVQWLRDRERLNAIGEIAKIDEGEARRRKLAAEAAREELLLAKDQGAAASILDFEKVASQIIGAFRAKLAGIGSGLADELATIGDAAECEALVQSAVNEALEELTAFEADLPDEPGGAEEPASGDPPPGATVRAASEPDRERVGGRRKTAKPGVER